MFCTLASMLLLSPLLLSALAEELQAWATPVYAWLQNLVPSAPLMSYCLDKGPDVARLQWTK